MHNPMDMEGRRILITGASSGIGRGAAIVLSRLGARLILSGRREDGLEETRSLLDAKDEHLVEPFDLQAVSDIPAWVDSLVHKTGERLNGIVHSAGIAANTPVRAMSIQSMADIVTTNTIAALALLKAAASRRITVDGATSVVFVSSAVALRGGGGLTAYSASKGALNSAIRSAAIELAPRGVRVNCIAPGCVETPMLARAREGLPGDAYQKIVDAHPLGVGTVEDVATAIAYLLSDAARWITGITLPVDGGFSA